MGECLVCDNVFFILSLIVVGMVCLFNVLLLPFVAILIWYLSFKRFKKKPRMFSDRWLLDMAKENDLKIGYVRLGDK